MERPSVRLTGGDDNMRGFVSRGSATGIILVGILVPVFLVIITSACASQNAKKNGWHSERKIVHYGTIDANSGILCEAREQLELYVALNPHISSDSTEEELVVEGCGYISEDEIVFATYHYEYTYETDEIIAKVLEINTEKYGPALLLHKLTYAPRT